jgi:predicted deacylase
MGIVSGTIRSKTVADVTQDEVTTHRSGTGGFFVPEVHVGDRVSPGHLLGRVVAPVGGETLEEVRADRDGVVVTVRVYPMVHASELLARIAAVGH